MSMTWSRWISASWTQIEQRWMYFMNYYCNFHERLPRALQLILETVTSLPGNSQTHRFSWIWLKTEHKTMSRRRFYHQLFLMLKLVSNSKLSRKRSLMWNVFKVCKYIYSSCFKLPVCLSGVLWACSEAVGGRRREGVFRTLQRISADRLR